MYLFFTNLILFCILLGRYPAALTPPPERRNRGIAVWTPSSSLPFLLLLLRHLWRLPFPLLFRLSPWNYEQKHALQLSMKVFQRFFYFTPLALPIPQLLELLLVVTLHGLSCKIKPRNLVIYGTIRLFLRIYLTVYNSQLLLGAEQRSQYRVPLEPSKIIKLMWEIDLFFLENTSCFYFGASAPRSPSGPRSLCPWPRPRRPQPRPGNLKQ